MISRRKTGIGNTGQDKESISCSFFCIITFIFVFFSLGVTGLFPMGKKTKPTYLPSLDPNKKISQYVYDVWTMEDGLPSDSIWAISQTTDGYIWLGTYAGLVRFNGVKFTVFNRDNTDVFKNNRVMALCPGKDGSLWIGTESDGLIRYKNGVFKKAPAKCDLASGSVLSIMEDRAGDTWIGGSNGITRYHDGCFIHLASGNGKTTSVHDIHQDEAGRIWFADNGRGVYCYHSRRLRHFTTTDGLSGNDAMCIENDSVGNLWIGTDGNGLNRYSAGTFSLYKDIYHSAIKKITTLLKDRAGTVWVGTDGGLGRLKGDTLELFTTKEGLADNRIRAVFEDREGNLWIGSYKGGLNRFKDGCITTFSKSEGLSDNFVWSIFEDSHGAVWVGTGTRGVNRVIGGKVTVFADAGLAENNIYSFLEDQEGKLWIGTQKGLKCYDKGVFLPDKLNFWVNAPVRSLYELASEPGVIWIGTRGSGVYRFKNGNAEKVFLSPSLVNCSVQWITEDPFESGTMWIGTNRGLVRIRDGNIRLYTTADGLSVNQLVTVYIDREGTMWIGTSGGGLNRFMNGRFASYTTSDGLLDDGIWSIIEDDDGNIWMSCDNGIFRAKKQNLIDHAEGKLKNIPITVYSIHDGLKSTESNGSGNPVLKQTIEGKLWYPMSTGVAILDLGKIDRNSIPPPVCIEDVVIGRRKYNYHQYSNYSKYNDFSDFNRVDKSGRSDCIRIVRPIPAGKKDFEFYFAALSYLNPQRVRFKYQLEGYDEHWINAGSRCTAYYTNLSPGDYMFKVIAANDEGVWNQTGARLSFYLKPHFYETYWFFGLLIFLFIFLVFAGYRIRVAGIKARNLELKKEIDERKRAEEELTHLQHLLENIIDSMPSVLIGVDESGRVTHWNCEATNLTNTKMNEAIGRPLDDVYPEFKMEKEKMRLAIEKRIPQVDEKVISKINNDNRYFNITIYPLVANGVDGAVIRIDDITEIEKREAQLRQAQKMDTVGTLAGGLAHDFNNILCGIIGALTLAKHKLSKYGDLDKKSLVDFFEIIEACGERATGLVKQLMTLSRKQDLVLAPVDLNLTIKHVMKICMNSLHKSVLLAPSYLDSPAIVKADPIQLEQVLLNFCVNADHAMTIMREPHEKWGGTLTITLEEIFADKHFCELHPEAKEKKYWNLSVRDEGVGMDTETASKMFNPFFSRKEKGKGTGLGLAMVYSIVTQHGGFIHYYSQLGIGTTFNIYFPVLEEVTEIEKAKDGGHDIPHGEGLIMVVDDEKIMRKIARSILEECGYEVIAVENGMEAVEMFSMRYREITLVLLDMAMPKLSGKDAFIAMKEIDQDVNVLLASGFMQDAHIESLLAMGVKGFIQKPFTLKKLANAVAAII